MLYIQSKFWIFAIQKIEVAKNYSNYTKLSRNYKESLEHL